MGNNDVRNTVDRIYQAQSQRHTIAKLTQEIGSELSVKQAYQVQSELLARFQTEGRRKYAPKLGLTSQAKWEQMGVDSPIIGYLLEDMLLQDSQVNLSVYIHPKVEPEIGIILKEDLRGPGLSRQTILDNLAAVCSCAEIIDSRYQNFDFTLTDVIADNTSAAGAIFGASQAIPSDFDWVNESVQVYVNEVLVTQGKGAAVLGHPLDAVIFLADFLAEEGLPIEKGKVIMTGGMTAAVPLQAGDQVELKFTNLAPITIGVSDK